MKVIKKVCQLMERCNGHRGDGGVKCIRKVCQLMERCDAHGRSIQELGEV